MNAPRELNAHIFEKHEDEWYVEEPWVSARLFDVEDFSGGIVDPCCGRGNILASARGCGLPAIGYDIVRRNNAPADLIPFAALDPAQIQAGAHIVCNPPFERARDFALHAIEIIGPKAKVAMIYPVRRLNAAGSWLARTPLKRVLYLTPRPSMPPGEVYEALLAQGKRPSGGLQDFCWLVWQRGYVGAPTVGWLHRDKGKGTA